MKNNKKARTTKYALILLLTLLIPMFMVSPLNQVKTEKTNTVDKNYSNDDEVLGNLKNSDAILSWWNESWNYRVRVEFKAQDKTIRDVPVEKRLNFTALFHELGNYSRFDWNSIRVLEYHSSEDQWIEIPYTASEYVGDTAAADYNNKTNAVVDIMWTMNGTTTYNSNRTYFIYFDTQKAADSKPLPDYGFNQAGSYGSYETKNLIYGDYFKLADFSAYTNASEDRVGDTHYGDPDNPFDDVYDYPIIDEQDDYEGKIGKVKDITNRQAHTGSDQRHHMEFYWDSASYENFPILKVAVKVDDPDTRTSLYIYTESGWKVIMFTPDAKLTQGTYQSGVDELHGAEIICDGKWRIYEYDLRRLASTSRATQIEWFQRDGAPNAHFFWFDNMLSYKAESETPTISNQSYLIPESYIYSPEIKRANVEVSTLDVDGNPLPGVNVSIYEQTGYPNNPLESKIADNEGKVSFVNLSHGEYNFTVTLTSDVGDHTILVNQTLNSIIIDEVSMSVNLTCNVGTHEFQVKDVGGESIESGWILVGNDTGDTVIQNCSISDGEATFRWSSLGYPYNYSVYYQDNRFNPQVVRLATGQFSSSDKLITVQTNFTTVNITVLSDEGDIVPGARLNITRADNNANIANLTTNDQGIAILRWFNSSGLEQGSIVNYQFEINFFGDKNLNTTTGPGDYLAQYDLTIQDTIKIEFRIQIDLGEYTTELISLNPTNNIDVEWGSKIKLRALFNITKAAGQTTLLGPAYADSMSYTIENTEEVVKSGNIPIEEENIGRHSTYIDTTSLETNINYLITISAQKSAYTDPNDLTLSLYLLDKDVQLNQSQNDDSVQELFWQEETNMSVNPYEVNTEELVFEDELFKEISGNTYTSDLFIPELSMDWNLSQITFDIYNVTFSDVGEPNINITITDPSGKEYTWDANNGSYYYSFTQPASNGTWNDLTIDLDQESINDDNQFDFSINGTFDGSIDVIASLTFIRDSLDAKFVQNNVSNAINIPSDGNGWGINKITFDLYNCHDPSDGSIIPDPTSIISKITAPNNQNYTFIQTGPGSAALTIDSMTIYPVNDRFFFDIINSSNIEFDVNISAEFIQAFYYNSKLSVNELSIIEQDYLPTEDLTFGPTISNWKPNGKQLIISNLKNSTDNLVLPSEVSMTITIAGQNFNIEDLQSAGDGYFDLTNIEGLEFNEIYSIQIDTGEDVTFDLVYELGYMRNEIYSLNGEVSYEIVEAPSVAGIVQYDSDKAAYQQEIDTSLINARSYTVKFTFAKQHYETVEKDLNLLVKERLTTLNGETELITEINKEIFVKDSHNFTLEYLDSIYGTDIADLKTQSYTWKQYDGEQLVDSGNGSLCINGDQDYILDFDTETKEVGTYSFTAILEKENYELKIASISLTIKKRVFDYQLGAIFEDKQTSIVKGESKTLQLKLKDPDQNDKALTNATVILTIEGKEFQFTEVEDGIYELEFTTEEYEAFVTSNTITGTIEVTREDYITQTIDVTIVVQMEETFGFPTFYMLLGIIGLVAVVGALVAYRTIQKARIPTFIKKADKMKKAIKSRKDISESLLYPSKEEFAVEKLGANWEEFGLSLDDVLGVGVNKKKSINKNTKTNEGGAK